MSGVNKLLLVAMFGAAVVAAQAATPPSTPSAPPSAAPAAAAAAPRQLNLVGKVWTGDFEEMLERRIIRVALPYSRSLYFVDKGRERGLSAELVRDFERWVNKTYAKQLGKRPLTVYIVAATRDHLLSDVADGRADLAVGNLSVTDERNQIVDFVAPDAASVNIEIAGQRPFRPGVGFGDELSGQTVHVRESSSYYTSLQALNARLRQAGKPPVKLVLVPDALEDEDMLEMVDAGLIGTIVVDDWKAKLWATVLPRLKLHEAVVLREDARKGWAIRKDSPQLQAALNDFYTKWVKTAGVIPYRRAST